MRPGMQESRLLGFIYLFIFSTSTPAVSQHAASRSPSLPLAAFSRTLAASFGGPGCRGAEPQCGGGINLPLNNAILHAETAPPSLQCPDFPLFSSPLTIFSSPTSGAVFPETDPTFKCVVKPHRHFQPQRELVNHAR